MNEDYQTLKHQAEGLRKQERFDEAIVLYEKLWNMSADNLDKWVGWGYAYCLRKAGRSTDALEICRDVYKLDAQFDRNNNLYGWCVYDTGIKQPEDEFNEKRFLEAAQAITQLTAQGDFSFYERTVLAVVHHYEKYKEGTKPVPHAEIIAWLDKLNPELLSAEPGRGADGKSYPSLKEDWYTSRAKALLGLERYEECIAVCTQALNEFKQLHYDYDVWFRNSRAESLLALGKGAEALPDIEYMMARKPDPWIRHRYALALRAIGRLDEAICYAAEAALPHQRLGYRWEVYLDLGEMLAEMGEDELAASHILLAAAIRKEEGWDKVPQRLQAALRRMNLSLENLPRVKDAHRRLQSFWKSQKPRPKTSHTGIIKLIHGNGKSGVIRADSGTEHFFAMRSYKGDAEPKQGLRVAFNVKEEINQKTERPELHAVDIVSETDSR